MNTQQMEQADKILSELLEAHAKTIEAFGKLSQVDKILYYPRFIESINRTEKLIQDARVKQLQPMANGEIR